MEFVFCDIGYLNANASFHLQDAKGNDIDLGIYKGKVLLFVNVASKWYSSSASFKPKHNYHVTAIQ